MMSCHVSETTMSNQLTNGHPAADYYFWCQNPRCNLNGGTYSDVMFPALRERMRQCDRLCDVKDLFTWTRQEELEIRRDEFKARHWQRIWRREQRQDYECRLCFVPDCPMALSLGLRGTTCFCDVCSCRYVMSPLPPLPPLPPMCVRRCLGRATYSPDAEETADEVPIVFENNAHEYAAGQNWIRRVKHHRETVQRETA